MTIAKLAFVAAFVIGGLGRYVFELWMPIFVLASLASALGFVAASLHLRLRPVPIADEVRAEAGDIWFASQHVRREQIMSACVLRRAVPNGEQIQIEVPLTARRRTIGPMKARGDVVIINVAREEDAPSIMREIEIDGWQPQRRVRLGKLSIARALVMFAFAVSGGTVLSALAGMYLGDTERAAYVWGITLFPIVFSILHEFATAACTEPALSILRDGLVIHGIFRRTPVAWSEIVSTGASRSTLLVECRSRLLRVRAACLDDARAHAIVKVIRRRVKEYGLRRSAHFSVYARGASDAAHWFRRLQQLVMSPSYRANGASISEAVTVLTSPAASADERVGAAVALRLAGVELEKAQFRAGDLANERVRVVLEGIEEARDDGDIEAELLRMRV